MEHAPQVVGDFFHQAVVFWLVTVDSHVPTNDGAVVVYETPGGPGVTWWLVDGVIPPQGAGPGGEALAELVPGATTETVPDPVPDSPPIT